MHGHLEENSADLPTGCPFSHLKGEHQREDLQGYHHFMKGTPPESPTTLGPLDETEQDSTQQVLFRLARMIAGQVVNQSNVGGLENRPESTTGASGIPAGYTYLLQFATHDLVNSSIALPVVDNQQPKITNRLTRQLNLETLYGGGPRNAHVAYSGIRAANQFRWKMKLQPPVDNPDAGPVRLLEMLETKSETNEEAKSTADMAMADIRNDSTIFLSQLTALFHAFHNVVVDALSSAETDGNILGINGQVVGDIGISARLVTAYVFRQIVKHDLLARLLDDDVYKAYCEDGPFLDMPETPGSVPIEFAHAVSRIGHSMVRPGYILNDKRAGQNNGMGFLIWLQNHGVNVPQKGAEVLNSEFLIDWDLFFDRDSEKSGSEQFNWSICMGPRVINTLRENRFFPQPYASAPFDEEVGLVFRDLLRQASSQLQPLHTMVDTIRKAAANETSLENLAAKLPDKKARKAMINDLLKDIAEPFMGLSDFEANAKEDRRKLAESPPILLYAMAETKAGSHPGTQLGPITSILFAETFFRAINRTRSEATQTDKELEKLTIELAKTAFGSLEDIPQSMPQLLDFMQETYPDALRT